VKKTDLERELRKLGYRPDRTGDHRIWEKEGSRPVQVPNHSEVNKFTAREILKIARGE
jgi:predicted RNA binding protein YcfA (HicA-like mRNA interferase family)